MTRSVYVVSAACTAIGTYGGALKDVPLTRLATTAVQGALERSGYETAAVGQLVMGNVIPIDVRDAYLSRITAKALYELQRIGGRYALVTMCIGGGQGIAAVFERA
jgi:acetyl-CoA acetyltransferase